MSKRYVHLLTPNAVPFLLLTLSSMKDDQYLPGVVSAAEQATYQ